MFDTYAQIFAKRAGEYHHAMKVSPHARDPEFLAVLEPIRDRPGESVAGEPLQAEPDDDDPGGLARIHSNAL